MYLLTPPASMYSYPLCKYRGAPTSPSQGSTLPEVRFLIKFYRYAEMPSETKNSISHRGKALKALKEYFESTTTTNERHSDEPENKKPRNFNEKTWHVPILNKYNYSTWCIFVTFVDFIIKESLSTNSFGISLCFTTSTLLPQPYMYHKSLYSYMYFV